MAYYGYNGDVDEGYSSSYGHVFGAAFPPYDLGEPNLINSHDSGVASQYSSPYDLGEPNLIDYSSPSYDDYSASAYSNPINYTCYDYSGYSVNQSETFYSQPKYLQYEPTPHHQGYFPSQTKFTVSYSKVEFDEPAEFPEYDPTPYGGGYDQTLTYGKPRPPSDLTCYPRSLPQSDAPPPENFPFSSIPSPYGRDDEPPIKPPKGSKPADTRAEAGKDNHVESGGKVNKPPNGINTKAETVESGGQANDDGKDVEIVEPKDVNVISNGDGKDVELVEPRDVNVISNGGYPSIEHQNGFNVPYGAGLEAMDICESIFGYWPCVAKSAEQQQRNSCQVCKPDSRTDPWKPAADYLFGSPVPYYDTYNYTHHDQSHYHYHYPPDQISWYE